MRLRLATPLALLALAVPVAGCGENEKDQYIDDFKPLNDKLLDVGRDLGVAVQGADDQSDDALAKQFAAPGHTAGGRQRRRSRRSTRRPT